MYQRMARQQSTDFQLLETLQVIERDSAGTISGLEGVTRLEGNVKTTKWKLTWLAKSEELIPLTLVDFDHILTKKKLEDDDEILDLINPCSVSCASISAMESSMWRSFLHTGLSTPSRISHRTE